MDLNKLEKAYPFMSVRNKTNIQQTLMYQGGDSIQVQPLAKVKIVSKGLLQIPDNSIFELVSPTIFDLKDKGIVSLQADKPAEKTVATPTVTPKK